MKSTNLLLVLAACSSSDAREPVVDATAPTERTIALILGQSNATDRGDTAEIDPSLVAPLDAVALDSWILSSLQSPLAWRSYSGPLAPHLTHFGVELSLGHALSNHDIVRCAAGGTSLAVNWDPDGTWPDDGGPNLYTQCMTFARGVATARAERISIVLWFQGEHDATVLEQANMYDVNLTRFHDRLKADLPGAALLLYKLPRAETYADIVRDGEQAFADRTDAILLDVDSLPRLGVHFTSAGYVTLGELSATAIGGRGY